jgi:hypothetical protein
VQRVPERHKDLICPRYLSLYILHQHSFVSFFRCLCTVHSFRDIIMSSILLYLTLLFAFIISLSDSKHLSHERLHHHNHPHAPRGVSNEIHAECLNPAQFQPDFFDYSVKTRDAIPQEVCPTSGVSVFARAEEDYSCGEKKPCSNGACCAKTGYCGYGPASCGTNGISPNDKCWSNCNAKAECGQYAKVPNTKCPLNVCCSEFGFCGTTKDFCGDKCQSNCKQPSVSYPLFSFR